MRSPRITDLVEYLAEPRGVASRRPTRPEQFHALWLAFGGFLGGGVLAGGAPR